MSSKKPIIARGNKVIKLKLSTKIFKKIAERIKEIPPAVGVESLCELLELGSSFTNFLKIGKRKNINIYVKKHPKVKRII